MPKPIAVLYNNDGAVDEFVALALLSTFRNVDLRGVVVTAADCLADAVNGLQKLMGFLGLLDRRVPVGLSNARGWNPFPWEYRNECIPAANIPILQPYPGLTAWTAGDGDRIMADVLDAAEPASITLLVNCPLTTLAAVLQEKPARQKAVSRLIWMGGAINVAGNLDPKTLSIANPTAEWNVFWDPSAVKYIFEHTDFPITLFPLDITDQAKITPAFLSALNRQAPTSPLSSYASQSYALVAGEPFYDMWNVVTTCVLVNDEIQIFAAPTPMRVRVVADGYYQGTILATADGRLVDIFLDFKAPKGAQAFYDFVLAQFRGPTK